MTEIITVSQIFYPLEILAIKTDFLWQLVFIFGGLAGFCFLLIFYFRNRLVAKERDMSDRKTELTPLIRNYLLQQAESATENAADLLWMKMEIRNYLDNPLDRKVITEIMLEVQRDGLPETRKQISALYQYFGLHDRALQHLESRKWDKVSRAISELTEMQVSQAYDAIKEHVNSKNSVVRKQAQLATIQLKEEGIQFFLDTAGYPISQWQQVKILEILTSNPEFKVPSFRDWLVSENQDVVLFALRLIRVFRQIDAQQALLMFLNHKSERIQVAAVECIGDFKYDPARWSLRSIYEKASTELKIHILDALQAIGNTEDISWLDQQTRVDASFLVRSKARLVVNTLQPVVGLTQMGIQGELELWAPESPGNNAENLSKPREEDPSEADIADDLFSSEPLLAHTLRPDFTTALRPHNPGDKKTTAEEDLEGFLIETPGDMTIESWTEEHEQVFGDCIIEELLDILNSEPVRDTPKQGSSEFLPWVTNTAQNTPGKISSQNLPEWVRELEVEVELLSGATGYAGILREILLEELRETERVLETEFIPGTGGGPPPEQKEGESHEEGDFTNMLFPEFEVDSEDIHLAEKSPGEHFGKSQGTTGLSCFSIFHEFFRSYDTESKLILMDQIHAVGGKKELLFLQGLFDDPDHRIRVGARKEHALLVKKLNISGVSGEAKEAPAIWTPSAEPEKSNPPEPMVDASEIEDLNFSPDQDFKIQEKGDTGKDLHPESENGYHRFLNYLKGTKNDTDA
jgi:hypothetical protein